jgi:hypothetical protein
MPRPVLNRLLPKRRHQPDPIDPVTQAMLGPLADEIAAGWRGQR